MLCENQDILPKFEELELKPSTKFQVIGASLQERLLNQPQTASHTIDFTKSEILIFGPGKFYLTATFSIDKELINIPNLLKLRVTLNPINTDKVFHGFYEFKRVIFEDEELANSTDEIWECISK